MGFKFIIGSVKIVDEKNNPYEFTNVEVNDNGITNLKIPDPMKFLQYGERIKAEIKLANDTYIYNFDSVIVRQFCKDGLLVGIRFFEPYPEAFIKLIEEKGELPQWARKSPRIPTVGELKYMPNFALVYNQPRNITCFVGDLGMGGCMIYTEDPHALVIQYNEMYSIELLPRADYESITFKGIVTRCEHDFNTKHQIGLYRIGVKFHSFDDKNKSLFTKKIKKVVEELQAVQ